MKNIAVFVSGSGSNFQSIIDNVENGEINGKISLLISSSECAYSLERASKHNIKSMIFAKKNFADSNELTDSLIAVLREHKIDLIVLAGYLSILSAKLTKLYENAIINIHPSLIPSFCGIGYYGLRVHKAVIDYGVKLTGATVHFVNENADEGAIILQESVQVLDDDTPEVLQQRVLKIEHKLLPLAVKLFCEDRLTVSGRKVLIRKQ